MKKWIALLLCLLLLVCGLTGCAGKQPIDGVWLMETDSMDLALWIQEEQMQVFLLPEEREDSAFLVWDASLTKVDDQQAWVATRNDSCPESFQDVFPDGVGLVYNEEPCAIVMTADGTLYGEYLASDISILKGRTVTNIDQVIDALAGEEG